MILKVLVQCVYLGREHLLYIVGLQPCIIHLLSLTLIVLCTESTNRVRAAVTEDGAQREGGGGGRGEGVRGKGGGRERRVPGS